MALWQLDFYLMPIEKVKYNLPFKQMLNESLLNWSALRINKQSFNELSKYFPIEKSWSTKIVQYGNLDGTCIEFFHNHFTRQISVRLDLAKLTQKEYTAALDFIRANKCALYRIDTGNCYNGDDKGLLQLIIESRLFDVMRKHNKFLEELYDTK